MNTALTSGTLTSLPGRYAKALFDLACDQGQRDLVGGSLRSLEKLVRSSAVLSQALANPTFERTEQATALKEMCVLMEMPEIVQSFAEYLMKSQRVPYLPQIEKTYQGLVSETKGECRVEIVSAWPLTSSQKEVLEGKLKKGFPGTVNLTFVQDPKVLGGIMVRAGSRVIDATLARHTNQLAAMMKGNA